LLYFVTVVGLCVFVRRWDLKTQTYENIFWIRFFIPVGNRGIVFLIVIVRIEEMRQSLYNSSNFEVIPEGPKTQVINLIHLVEQTWKFLWKLWFTILKCTLKECYAFGETYTAGSKEDLVFILFLIVLINPIDVK
jgi:NADH:ubiquinone oxidoreductase subunit D